MEERFRPLTFHGLVLRSQLVTLLVRGVCYSESQSVSLASAVLEGGIGTRTDPVGPEKALQCLWCVHSC